MSLDSLKIFLEQNSLLFFIIFVLSFLANIFEIFGFFREKRKSKEEKKRRDIEEQRLKIYEYLFDTAEKSISSEDELQKIREEIANRKSLIPTLEKRIESLKHAAKKEIAEQNISRTVGDIKNSFEELNKLKEQQKELGELPDLPESEKEHIRSVIFKETHKPYELPKSISYKSILLVLVILLLPSPADQLMLVVLLGMFLTTFFQVAMFSGDSRLTNWVTRNFGTIGFLSSFGAWFFLIRNIDSLLGRPLSMVFNMIADDLRVSLMSDGTFDSTFAEIFIMNSYRISEFLILILAFIISFIHWRKIRNSIVKIINQNS